MLAEMVVYPAASWIRTLLETSILNIWFVIPLLLQMASPLFSCMVRAPNRHGNSVKIASQ